MKREIQISLVLSIIVGMTVIAALSTPVPGTFAIRLENDDSVANASEVLESTVPGISVIEYKSLKYDLLSHRIVNPIVWIGHGNEEGIATENELISWSDFSDEISNTLSNDIVLACHSSNLIEQTTLTDQDVFTFNGEIDSKFGALVTAYLITQDKEIYDATIDHIFALYANEVEYNPLPYYLDDGGGGGGGINPDPIVNCPDTYEEATTDTSYVFAKMSGVELGYHILMLVMLFFDLILGYACSKAGLNFFATFATEFWLAGFPILLFSFVLHSRGSLSDEQLTEDIFGSFLDSGEAFTQAWHASSAGEKAAIIAFFAAAGIILLLEFVVDFFTGALATFVRTAIAVTLVLLFIYDFVVDCSDDNTYVG